MQKIIFGLKPLSLSSPTNIMHKKYCLHTVIRHTSANFLRNSQTNENCQDNQVKMRGLKKFFLQDQCY